MSTGAPLRLYNTMSRRVETFTPIEAGVARVYTCGPTVYADQHIGNLRAYVFSDTLRRTLAWKGLDVRHVINITDVGHLTSDEDAGEDKVELASRREGRTIWEIAEHYTAGFMRDLDRLRILQPTRWCKATEHIGQMVAFAEAIEGNGFAYRLPSGLYFDTGRDPTYGELARLDVEGLREGARVEAVEGKRRATDFAVWRTTPPGESRQMEWESPWGRGAPGWHLECSVMSIEYLGPHFDIHTGGIDHIPVHHVNEIAQSQALLGDGRPWVRTWLHNDFINLTQAKMSKSAGTTVLLGDLVDAGYHPAVYRYLLLTGHYRTQMDFDWSALDGAKVALRRLLERLGRLGRADGLGDGTITYDEAAAQLASDQGLAYLDELDGAMVQDLNTPKALAVFGAAARDEALGEAELGVLAAAFDAVLGLGLLDLRPQDLELRRAGAGAGIEEADVDRLVAERDQARAARDFGRADRVREELADLGVELMDSADGTAWRWR